MIRPTTKGPNAFGAEAGRNRTTPYDDRVKPLIAINTEIEGSSEAPKLVLPLRYIDTLEEAGARPVVLPPVQDAAVLDDLLRTFDGLMLSGADDFDTDCLGLGPTHPAAKPVPARKQSFDGLLVKRALELGMPILGVCYGMQLMGLLSGGSLHQHLPEDLPESQEHRGGVVHDVRVQADSKLAELTGVENISVVSRHHQALAGVGPDWTVSATDDEGLIEAIEHRSHPFAVGVQWHPELGQDPATQSYGRRLLQGFVAATRSFASIGT